jgi:hypothetical protein
VYCLANTTDVYDGQLIRLRERKAEWRCNHLGTGCTRPIAWPAWPERVTDYNPHYSW